jgi:hypothetical protein
VVVLGGGGAFIVMKKRAAAAASSVQVDVSDQQAAPPVNSIPVAQAQPAMQQTQMPAQQTAGQPGTATNGPPAVTGPIITEDKMAPSPVAPQSTGMQGQGNPSVAGAQTGGAAQAPGMPVNGAAMQTQNAGVPQAKGNVAMDDGAAAKPSKDVLVLDNEMKMILEIRESIQDIKKRIATLEDKSGISAPTQSKKIASVTQADVDKEKWGEGVESAHQKAKAKAKEKAKEKAKAKAAKLAAKKEAKEKDEKAAKLLAQERQDRAMARARDEQERRNVQAAIEDAKARAKPKPSPAPAVEVIEEPVVRTPAPDMHNYRVTAMIGNRAFVSKQNADGSESEFSVVLGDHLAGKLVTQVDVVSKSIVVEGGTRISTTR